MSRARVLWHLLRADFLERVRRYSFLFTLALAAWLGWLVATGTIGLWIGDARGVYNSAWIGTTMALVINTFLALAGFWVVKSAVERDRRTGVGEILATTPMSKTLYALGKVASNFAVLVAMVGVLMAAALIAQLVAGEEARVDLWALLAPFFFLALPAMAVVAAMAVLFEMIPLLRDGFGNVAWFFVWTATIPIAMQSPNIPDFVGIGPVNKALQQVVAANFGKADRGFTLGGIKVAQPKTFHWDGMDWTGEVLAGRLFWIAVAFGVALLAALFFDRFDPARHRLRRERRKAAIVAVPEGDAPRDALPAVHLTPLPAGALRFRFAATLIAELRLALQGQRWWWYAGAAGLFIAGLATPAPQVRQVVLPLAWIWPILIWSALGNREARFGTSALLFSSARPLGRQLPATWLAGVVLAMTTGGGVALRLLFSGDSAGLGAWLAGALFIPTLALALGVWSGTSKLFEVVYLLLWYIGPMNHVPAMDYLGATKEGLAAGMPLVYLGVTTLLAAAAVAGRRRQILAG